MPFLIPPSEFKPGELTQLGLTGTCELQICRSAGPWSLGTPDKVEHSIQNAYLKGMCTTPRLILDTSDPVQPSSFPNILSTLKISSSSHRTRSFSPLFRICSSILMGPTGQRWKMCLLRIRLVTRSSIASFAHIVKAKSGDVASSSRSSLASPSPSIIPMLARQV
jgi:hypothetical protein